VKEAKRDEVQHDDAETPRIICATPSTMLRVMFDRFDAHSRAGMNCFTSCAATHSAAAHVASFDFPPPSARRFLRQRVVKVEPYPGVRHRQRRVPCGTFTSCRKKPPQRCDGLFDTR
jgi:hypothetical protein